MIRGRPKQRIYGEPRGERFQGGFHKQREVFIASRLSRRSGPVKEFARQPGRHVVSSLERVLQPEKVLGREPTVRCYALRPPLRLLKALTKSLMT
jgi:hypothetical protein